MTSETKLQSAVDNLLTLTESITQKPAVQYNIDGFFERTLPAGETYTPSMTTQYETIQVKSGQIKVNGRRIVKTISAGQSEIIGPRIQHLITAVIDSVLEIRYSKAYPIAV